MGSFVLSINLIISKCITNKWGVRVMNIKGQIVDHKVFGIGTVINADQNSIVVSFSVGEKAFQFPDAIGSYLKAEDKEFSSYAEMLRQEKEEQEAEAKIKKAEEESNRRAVLEREYSAKHTTKVRANIAFKCNFCDGGKSGKQVGFEGVCSDAVINNNIAVEHRTWCNSEDCACLDYFNGEISREELDQKCEDCGFVCYESQMLRDWKALAGIVQKGDRKGEPMKLHQVQRNSLCVLTTRNPGSCENDRYIFGVFLVDDTYEGDGIDEGYVSTSSKYKLKLSPKEAQKLLFWNYHSNSNNPEVPAWNSGLHRYFQDDVAAQILRDIVGIKKETDDYLLAEEFLEHFCEINRVIISDLDAPDGALKR
jgi:hypothetical protein